jgi:hypothetical protein
MVEVPRPVFCLTSRSRNRRSSVSLVIAATSHGREFRAAALPLTGGAARVRTMGSAISASLTTWQVCQDCRADNHLRSLLPSPLPAITMHNRPGEAKASPERGSLVALQRTNGTNGRAANDHRAYEDPMTVDRRSVVRAHPTVPVRSGI